MAASSLSKDLGTEVRIGNVKTDFFNQLVFNDLFIADQRGDTLLYAPRFTGTVHDYQLGKRRMHFGKVQLDKARIKLKKYEGDTVLNFQFLIDYFKPDTSHVPDTTAWDIQADLLALSNIHFSLQDLNADTFHNGFNFHDIALQPFHLQMDRIHLQGDSLYARLSGMGLKDKRGLAMDTLKGNLSVSPHGILLDSADIITPNSSLHAHLGLKTRSYASYRHFLEEVAFDIRFNPSVIDLADVAYFVPNLLGTHRVVQIEAGHIREPLTHLRGKGMLVKTGQYTSFNGDFLMQGLPYMEETFIGIHAKRITTHPNDLALIQLPPYHSTRFLQVPPQIQSMGEMKIKGRFDGFINDFVAQANMRSDAGWIKTDVKVTSGQAGVLRYSGQVDAHNFDLGTVFGLRSVGHVTGVFKLDSAIGVDPEYMFAKGEGTFASFRFNDYEYRNIEVNGQMKKGLFRGRLESNDPNIGLVFDGRIDLTQKLPVIQFDAKINDASLATINLIKRDSTPRVSAYMHFDLTGNNADNLKGEVRIDSLFYSEGHKSYFFPTLSLKAIRDSAYRSLEFRSPVADAFIGGDFNFARLPGNFEHMASYIMPAIFEPHTDDGSLKKQQFDFEVRVKDFNPITETFLPFVELDPFSELSGGYNSESDYVLLEGASFAIRIAGKRILNPEVEIRKVDEHLQMQITADKIGFTDRATLDNFTFHAFALQDDLFTSVKWQAEDSTAWGSLFGTLYVQSPTEFEYEITPSVFHLADMHWEIQNNATVAVSGDTIRVGEVRVKNNGQSLALQGAISKKKEDKLELSFENFYLNTFNPLLAAQGVELQGILNGSGSFSDFYNDLVFESEYFIETTMLNEIHVGEVYLKSDYDKTKKALNLSGSIEKQGFKTFHCAGNYYPAKKKKSLDIQIAMDQTDLYLANAFIPPGTLELGGHISGQLHVGGTPSAMRLDGAANLSNASILVDYTNTRYLANGTVRFHPDWIGLDGIPLVDKYGNTAIVTGTMQHRNFDRINLDMGIFPERFFCLNTDESMNDLFYGTAFVSGDVYVEGKFGQDLKVEANVTSEEGTVIHLPLGGSTTVEASDFVMFNSEEDPPQNQPPPPDLLGVNMQFNMDVTDAALFRLLFDEKVGDVMQGRGEGAIRMDIDSKGKFGMAGLLTVTEGDYLFTLQNVLNKHFQVAPGGTIKWSGDPYHGTMDLDAIYKVRTTLYDLMVGTGEAEKYKSKRIPVELVMGLTETLLKPEILFSIRFPTIDDQTQSQVNSILSSAEELNRQAFSLLMLQKFLPAGSFSAGNVVSGSSMEVLTNQFNVFASNVFENLDVNVDWQPGDEISEDEVSVALSTQLFNDRLTVSGNFGVTNNASETGGLLGDFLVEYQVDRDNKLRLKAYNESNNDDFSTADQGVVTTQGIGISYHEQFDSLHQLEILNGLFNLFRRNSHPRKVAYKERKAAEKAVKARRRKEKERKKQENIARYKQMTNDPEEHNPKPE